MYSQKSSLVTRCCLVFNHLIVNNKRSNNPARATNDPEVFKVDKNKWNPSMEDTAVDTT